jgi:hypothetical protein
MREEQGRLSKQVMKLLKLDAKGLRKAISEALARSRVAGQERAKIAAEQLRGAQKTSALARRGKRLGPRGPYKMRHRPAASAA